MYSTKEISKWYNKKDNYENKIKKYKDWINKIMLLNQILNKTKKLKSNLKNKKR